MENIGAYIGIGFILSIGLYKFVGTFLCDDGCSINDAIHLELLKYMPGICTDQYRMFDRDILDNVCNVTVRGAYEQDSFCVRFQVSDAMGTQRIINIIMMDESGMGLQLERGFKESEAITGYGNDNFIRRLGRALGGIFTSNNVKR